MSWSKSILLMILLVCLEACGFRPQYAKIGQSSQGAFDSVYIAQIRNKHGQSLHNKLIDFVGVKNQKQTRYTFGVDLQINHREIGFERNLNAVRFEVVVEAPYTFTDRQNKVSPKKGTCRSSEYYSVSKLQIFQNISASEDAPKRGIDVVSRCLVDRLSILMSQASEQEKK